MPLNKFEKEKRVIELHLEGKTIRDMSKEVRMSFRDISKIRKDYEKTKRLETKKEDKPSNQKSKKPSISSRAFKLFSEGKKPTDVAIEVDISAEKVEKLWSQFLNLESMPECYEFYQECRYDLPTLLSINNFMKRNSAYGNDIANVLRQAQTIANLQIHLTIIKKEIERLQKVKNNYQQYF